jgi:hypothetical protein
MRAPRYPLEPLADLRDDAVDEAVRGLAAAVAAREGAELARRASEQRRDDHDSAAARVRVAEQGALGRGELRVSDLLAARAWEERVAAERAALESGVDRAKGAEAAAREAERGAQREVTEREAEAKVLEKDRERWQEAARKRADARDEEEAAEAYRPRR